MARVDGFSLRTISLISRTIASHSVFFIYRAAPCPIYSDHSSWNVGGTTGTIIIISIVPWLASIPSCFNSRVSLVDRGSMNNCRTLEEHARACVRKKHGRVLQVHPRELAAYNCVSVEQKETEKG